MKIIFLSVGQRHDPMLATAIDYYTRKVGHYYKCAWELLTPAKLPASAGPMDYLELEAHTIAKALSPIDFLVLLDERGKMLSSPELAGKIESAALSSVKSIGFLIGGAYGVHEKVRQSADFIWSLSNLVLPHQLVRLVLAEQVYRACTILRNEKYHHG